MVIFRQVNLDKYTKGKIHQALLAEFSILAHFFYANYMHQKEVGCQMVKYLSAIWMDAILISYVFECPV